MTTVADAPAAQHLDRGTRLLAAKIAAQPVLSGMGTQQADDIIRPLVTAGLAERERLFLGTVQARLTDRGHAVAAQATPGDLFGDQALSGRDAAKAALWFWLLVRADTGPWGNPALHTHLLTCGLDLHATSEVDDMEPVRHPAYGNTAQGGHGVIGHATCRCGAVHNFVVNRPVPSVVDMVAALLG